MKINDKITIEIPSLDKVKIIREKDQLIIYDKNIILKIRIFTDKYINDLLQKENIIV